MQSTVERCLHLIHEAESLQQTIMAALSEGDREKAESLCYQHQRAIEAIPFSELTEPLPLELLDALQRLQQGNNQLAKITAEIQIEIGKQLSGVQKGKLGSDAYSSVNKHQ